MKSVPSYPFSFKNSNYLFDLLKKSLIFVRI